MLDNELLKNLINTLDSIGSDYKALKTYVTTTYPKSIELKEYLDVITQNYSLLINVIQDYSTNRIDIHKAILRHENPRIPSSIQAPCQ